MVSRLVALSSNVIYLSGSHVFQRYTLRPSTQFFALTPISQIFMRTLSQTSDSLATQPIKAVDFQPSLFLENNIKEPNLQDLGRPKRNIKWIESDLMSFDEYAKKHLISFNQYKEKYKEFIKTDERGSSSAKIQKAYERYAKMSYKAYREKFFPPPNPLIF